VLGGAAAEHERDVPFGLVVDALDDHVAGLHPRRIATLTAASPRCCPRSPQARSPPRRRPAETPAERFLLHRALRGLLELLARERPVALVLDDLTGPTRRRWGSCCTSCAARRGLPHCSSALRPAEAAAAGARGGRAAPGLDAPRAGATPHERALAAIGHVADPVARERIAAVAAGNPLFLHELARVAADPGDAVPRTLVAAIRLEAAALPPPRGRC
jgi:hypothetical protein